MPDIAAWLFQQRDALAAFLAVDGELGFDSLSGLLDESGVEFVCAGDPHDVIIDQWHSRPSRVRVLIFRDLNTDATWQLPVPVPNDDGIFCINGRSFVAPFQRLLPQNEYRRLDTCLSDLWQRRLFGVSRDCAGFTLKGLATETKGGERILADLARAWGLAWFNALIEKALPVASRALALFLMAALRPDSTAAHVPSHWRPDPILEEVRGGAWRLLSLLPAVRTFQVALVDDYRYSRIWCPDRLSVTQRQTPDTGIDRFHTPEGKAIGLVRRLNAGVFVSKAGTLEPHSLSNYPEAPGTHLGAVSACIPFLRNNDPRRVLLGCNMLSQAVRLNRSEEPRVITSAEEALRAAVPRLVPPQGANLRTAFMLWHGYNYEDAVVLSTDAASKLGFTEKRHVTCEIPAFVEFERKDDEEFEQGIRRIGTHVRKGQPLVQLRCNPEQLDLRLSKELQQDCRENESSDEWKHYSLESPCNGRIIAVHRIELFNKENTPAARRFRERVDFTIAVHRPLQVGDKLCNRYGNKGVVSKIVPTETMPLWKGKSLEVLFNPIGVLNRGNYGQLYEAIYGAYLEECKTPTISLGEFEADPVRLLPEICKGAGLDIDGTDSVSISAGTGKREYRCVSGITYILRLPHHATDRLKVHTTGKYSRRTGQPPHGHGQKYGEMEMWCLQAHGVETIISELQCEGIGLQEPGPPSTERHGADQSGPSVNVPPATTGASSDGDAPQPQAPVAILGEYLRALALEVDVQDECLTVKRRTDDGPIGTELFDANFKCKADNGCNSKKEDKRVQRVSRRVAERRLISPAVECETAAIGGLCVDLGERFSIDCRLPEDRKNPRKSKKDRPVFHFEGRYLPILPLRLRWSPSVTSRSRMTSRYLRLLEALWCRRTQAASWKPTDEQIKARIQATIEALLDDLDGKYGIVRSVYLSRRLEYSCRMVIVPDPDLSLDDVSLPWDAIRRLYGDVLKNDPQINARLKQSARRITRDSQSEELRKRVDAALEDQRVLANRNPSLTQYSILAFRPRVHFDGPVMKLCPFVTTPFGADFDGDTMTAVRLRRRESIEEAERLLPSANLLSAVDRDPVFPPTKEFLFGLALTLSDDKLRPILDKELGTHGLSALPACKLGDATDRLGQYIDQYASGRDAAGLYEALSAAAIRAFMQHHAQSAIGSATVMARCWEPFLHSHAAKDLLTNSEADQELLGAADEDWGKIGRFADERIGIMMLAETQKGPLGGLIRRFYYRIPSQVGSEQFRRALAVCQWMTAKATQKALSPKNSAEALTRQEFLKALREARASCDESGKLAETLNLANVRPLRERMMDIPDPDGPVADGSRFFESIATFLANLSTTDGYRITHTCR